jgi:hypothetical protein
MEPQSSPLHVASIQPLAHQLQKNILMRSPWIIVGFWVQYSA